MLPGNLIGSLSPPNPAAWQGLETLHMYY